MQFASKYIVIRPQPEDAQAVVDLQDETWVATYINKDLGITESDILTRRNNLENRIQKRKESFSSSTEKQFIVKDNSQVIAWLSVELSPTKNDINALYVHPAFQGKGIGTLLMQSAFAVLDQAKPIRLTVASYNTRAIKFYEKFGFIVIGEYHREKPISLNGKIIPELQMVYEKSKSL